MRPLPVPLRSARRFSVSAPVICHSVSPASGSLLATETIFNDVMPTASLEATLSVTATIFLLGGQIDVTDGVMLVIAGAVVSRTVTVNEPVVLLPAASVAV